MALRYIVCDADLTKAEVAIPEEDAVQATREVSGLKRTLWFCILLVANVIVWALAYDLWAGNKLRVLDYLTFRRAMVRGIVYSDEKPCAIIRDEVVQEGDTIEGYRVVRIHPHKVELEKGGKIFTRQVR
ncbi:MAG: hypothetical protein ACYS9T_02455 [Planctomycetota bacterium]|jgi:hypothetical protein